MISASTSGSMLPPHSTSPTLRPAKRSRSFITRREADRAGAFDHGLLDLEQHQDRLLDVVLADQHDVVDQARISGSVSAPGCLDARCRRRSSPAHRAGRRRAPRSRQPGSARSARRRSGCRARSARAAVAMPEISPPPPIATHQRVDRRLLLEHLEADRALAGDHREIVVRMHDGQRRARSRARGRVARASSKVSPSQHDFAPKPRVRSTLTDGAKRGITIVAGDAHPLGVVRDRLRVVAGRHREHAVRTLVGGQLRHLVERAALLERRGELQVLELQEDLAAGELRQRARRQAWRARDFAGSRSAAARMSSTVSGAVMAPAALSRRPGRPSACWCRPDSPSARRR